MPKRTGGFSLIELMIVVVIIGILVAIFIPNYISMQNRNRENKVKANAHQLELVVKDYAVRFGTFPKPEEIIPALFPTDYVYPNNPFTGEPTTIGNGLLAEFSPGLLRYAVSQDRKIYTIEGCGEKHVVITLTNAPTLP